MVILPEVIYEEFMEIDNLNTANTELMLLTPSKLGHVSVVINPLSVASDTNPS